MSGTPPGVGRHDSVADDAQTARETAVRHRRQHDTREIEADGFEQLDPEAPYRTD